MRGLAEIQSLGRNLVASFAAGLRAWARGGRRAAHDAPPPTPGRHLLDAGSCDECGKCEAVCPPGCLLVVAQRASGSPARLLVDYGRCIHCQRCVDLCPRGCLQSSLLDLPVTSSRLGLVIDLRSGRSLAGEEQA